MNVYLYFSPGFDPDPATATDWMELHRQYRFKIGGDRQDGQHQNQIGHNLNVRMK